GDAYRLPPGLVFWLAVALAGLCGAAALVVGGRWALRLRQPVASALPGAPTPYLERALALFFWANAHGDETLQRKALERVADGRQDGSRGGRHVRKRVRTALRADCDGGARARGRQPGDGARHVLRHRLRAPAAELARQRAAGLRALLRPAGRRQQHAGLRGHT